jgi:hypothetical protein
MVNYLILSSVLLAGIYSLKVLSGSIARNSTDKRIIFFFTGPVCTGRYGIGAVGAVVAAIVFISLIVGLRRSVLTVMLAASPIRRLGRWLKARLKWLSGLVTATADHY